ncbi:MAG TPA: hypothetical protein VNT03_01095 [Baekduia sp.]|nr:hypothetical protein [Baekduia sp.]
MGLQVQRPELVEADHDRRAGVGQRVELDLGRWDDALDTAAIVLREPRVRARRGDPDVWAPLNEALALAKRGEELQAGAPVAAARAEAFWLQGKRDEVEQATAGARGWAFIARKESITHLSADLPARHSAPTTALSRHSSNDRRGVCRPALRVRRWRDVAVSRAGGGVRRPW